ncbi:MAG: hypothetical protein KJ011_16740 [Burkholderiaceae bacterium]|nr:hypothetical protein [Burkholderiaceae bacterium]
MNAKTPALKIWIVVDALERSGDVLGAVTRFAAGRVVELAGLFVEDADLVRLAGWPAATETRLFEVSSRPFGSAELEATLRAQAAALQRRLDALAREIGVPWSFRTVRGHVVQQALSLAGGDDWIVLASASTTVQLRARQMPAARPVLWLLPEDEQGLTRLQEAAARYDPLGSAERRVVLPADARGAAAIRASAAVAGGALRSTTQAELTQWIACAPRSPGGLVLMTRAAGAADPERLRQLLRRGAAPLVLV